MSLLINHFGVVKSCLLRKSIASFCFALGTISYTGPDSSTIFGVSITPATYLAAWLMYIENWLVTWLYMARRLLKSRLGTRVHSSRLGTIRCRFLIPYIAPFTPSSPTCSLCERGSSGLVSVPNQSLLSFSLSITHLFRCSFSFYSSVSSGKCL